MGFAAVQEAITKVRKTADETVNNSTVLQDDDELLFAIGASETWEFTFSLRWISNTTADGKFQIVFPTGASFIYGGLGYVLGNTNQDQNGYDTAMWISWDTGYGTDNLLIIKGHVVNSTTAGNVQLKWAQNTATVVDTIVKAGSYIIAHKIS